MESTHGGKPEQKPEERPVQKPHMALQEEGPEQGLSQLLGGALEGKVKEKIVAFGGLLTREAAVRLLCQENGISTEKRLALSEARSSRLPFSFSARVDRVFPIQQFPGGTSCTVRLHVSDKSGEATLVLWNEQAKQSGGFLAGDAIECSGAYFRSGEISIGRRGSISRSGASGAVQVGRLAPGICNVEGTVGKVEGPRAYKDRKSGADMAMHSFMLQSGGKSVRVVAWSYPKEAVLVREGEDVVLENADFRGGELHLNAFSRIVKHGGEGKAGIFSGMEIAGGDATFSIGPEKFQLTLQEALAVLGIGIVPSGVDASTLLSIKARALEGKEARYFSEGGHLSSLKFEN